MLNNLYIENYVLFDKQDLAFNNGFSALTGDTGAGKSLIIDALSYLCGERLSGSIAKDKTKNTYLEGHFTFKNPKTIKMLEEIGIESDEFYIVSREINVDNKSIARINGRSVTLAFLKQLFEHEIDIHSQQDSQYLLNKKNHLELLDEYSQHQNLLENTKDLFEKYNLIKKEIFDLENSVFNEDEIEFIKIQIKEIEQANINEEEYNELLEKTKVINSYESIYSSLYESVNNFNQNNKIIDLLFESKDLLSKISSYDNYEDLYQQVNSLYLEAVDISSDLAAKLSSLEFDENELNQIEERLFTINSLLKRHGSSFDNFKIKYESMLDKVAKFEDKEYILMTLNKKLKTANDEYLLSANKLRESRLKNIKKLEKDIILNLKDLHMEDAKFKISLSDKTYSKNGIDDVEFLVSTNKGFALAPLINVASGGELSRLMLGLKVVFSKLFGVSTVIFDEIDIGVSGSVASSIGFKMAELSKFSQVFSVTHLAQVAACSNYHYYVEKDKKSSKTIVNLLDDKDKLDKLAFMAFGSVSENSLNAAKELYNNSQLKISDNLE